MSGHIELNIKNLTDEETLKIKEVLLALIASGGLFGVKNGKTILHFDGQGDFQGVQLDYWPWRKRNPNNAKVMEVE
jgi:hypothetical protein